MLSKGLKLGKAMWNTAKKFGVGMAKMGKKAFDWATNPKNLATIEKMIALVKQGVEVGQLIAGLGAAGPIPAAELKTVDAKKEAAVADVMDADDYVSSGDDSPDEGKTVGEMLDDD